MSHPCSFCCYLAEDTSYLWEAPSPPQPLRTRASFSVHSGSRKACSLRISTERGAFQCWDSPPSTAPPRRLSPAGWWGETVPVCFQVTFFQRFPAFEFKTS